MLKAREGRQSPKDVGVSRPVSVLVILNECSPSHSPLSRPVKAPEKGKKGGVGEWKERERIRSLEAKHRPSKPVCPTPPLPVSPNNPIRLTRPRPTITFPVSSPVSGAGQKPGGVWGESAGRWP